jgi:hypothetical protein
VIVTSGGVVSTVHEYEAGETLWFPALSTAQTSNVCDAEETV